MKNLITLLCLVTTLTAQASAGERKLVAEVVTPKTPHSNNTGVPPEVLYKKYCASCHVVGTQGAPRLGDKVAWKPLIAAGMPSMMEVVMKGSKKNPLMLPRAGTRLKEEELKPIVEYMVKLSK